MCLGPTMIFSTCKINHTLKVKKNSIEKVFYNQQKTLFL